MNPDDVKRIINWDALSRLVNRWSLLTIEEANHMKIRSTTISPDLYKPAIYATQFIFDKFPNCMVLTNMSNGYPMYEYARIYFYGTNPPTIIEVLRYIESLGYVSRLYENSDSIVLKMSGELYNHIIFMKTVFKSKSSIAGHAGGSAISSEAIIYDGKEVLYTPMAAASIVTKLHIIRGGWKGSNFGTEHHNLILANYCNVHNYKVILPNLIRNGSQYIVIGNSTYSTASKLYDSIGKHVEIAKGCINPQKYVLSILGKDTDRLYTQSETVDGLLTNPVFVTETDIRSTMNHLNVGYRLNKRDMIETYSILGREIGNIYFGSVCCINGNRNTDEDTVILRDIINNKVAEIMTIQAELIKTHKMVPLVENDISTATWYGDHFDHTSNFNALPDVFVAIQQCLLSDNIRQALLEQQYNIFNMDCYRHFF